ncbi:hypothetical protein J6590_014343 [Homalodisca vitripennis]|nr:hypothetical protein J6590_014343 [Homalodisca vitripennis]
MNRHNPWYVKGDTDERNARARKAYTALLTVTARTPNNEAYRNFSYEVKRLAEEEFNFTFGSVSTFVTAFYDAVLLYSVALNETLQSGGSQRDGLSITRRMWNRTFEDKRINFNHILSDNNIQVIAPLSGRNWFATFLIYVEHYEAMLFLIALYELSSR